MTPADVEALCLALPGAHKVRLWDRLDVYKLASKVFCTCEAGEVSFKTSEILYALLIDDGPGRPASGFVPGAWLTMPLSEVEPADAQDWVERSHGYAAAGLTKAKRAELGDRMITREEIEGYALGLKAATKVVQWGGSDVYKVGGKVFAVVGFENGLAFKVSEIGFEVLTSDGGPGRQAPYFAKGGWVVVDMDAVDFSEASGWLGAAHSLIAAKLTKAARAELGL